MITKRQGVRLGVRKKILERDGYVCAYCGGKADCVDHVIPWAYSQSNSPSNLVASCTDCNAMVSDRVFPNIEGKRKFIQTLRASPKWQRRIKNRQGECFECGEIFFESAPGATQFLCPKCAANEPVAGTKLVFSTGVPVHRVAAKGYVKPLIHPRPGRPRFDQDDNDRAEEVFQYIVDYKTKHDGVSPTMREICVALNILSTSNIPIYLKVLTKQGRIVVGKSGSRGIYVVGGSWHFDRSKRGEDA